MALVKMMLGLALVAVVTAGPQVVRDDRKASRELLETRGNYPGPGVPPVVLPYPGPGVPAPSNCRYWCKTPEGQAYCCEGNNQPLINDEFRPGFCPPVRKECPTRIFAGPPQTCSKHGDCSLTNRCCFDRCLEEHVCKESLPTQG